MKRSSLAVLLTILALCAIAVWMYRHRQHVRQVEFSQENAVWVQSTFFRGYQPTTKEPLKRDRVLAFARTLKQNHIKYAYMFAGPYEKDGHLPAYAFGTTALSSVQLIMQEYPDVILLPWVGGVVNRTVFLADPQWAINAISDTAKIVRQLHVSGVHVNFEFFTYAIPGESFPGVDGIDSYAENEQRFFEHLRQALPGVFISTVAESTVPQTRHWKRKNTSEEIAQLSAYVDQIAILFFDTSIRDKPQFQEALLSQLQDIRRWKNSHRDKHVQYLLGLGTFVNKPELWGFRDLEVESIPNTLITLRRVLERYPSLAQTVDGIAIFADWTTTDEAWFHISNGWTSPQFGASTE